LFDAAVTCAVGNGLSANRPSTSSNVVLPHRFTGEVIAKRGDISARSSK
jgi:hypothetical protein